MRTNHIKSLTFDILNHPSLEFFVFIHLRFFLIYVLPYGFHTIFIIYRSNKCQMDRYDLYLLPNLKAIFWWALRSYLSKIPTFYWVEVGILFCLKINKNLQRGNIFYVMECKYLNWPNIEQNIETIEFSYCAVLFNISFQKSRQWGLSMVCIYRNNIAPLLSLHCFWFLKMF